MKHCAIYTRVSTSMQAEIEYNSCEASNDRIASFIKSQENLAFVREYRDAGYSGGNLDRPALSELVRDKTVAVVRSDIQALIRSFFST